MRMYVDRTTIKPHDLKISEQHDVEITDAEHASYGDERLMKALAFAIRDCFNTPIIRSNTETFSAKIHAIKAVRTATGSNLRDAKRFVEVLMGEGWSE